MWQRLAGAQGWCARSTSARISQPRRDAADRRGDGAVHLRRVFAGALAAQHVHLDQVHGIDVGIAQLDGVGEHLVGFEQLCLAQ